MGGTSKKYWATEKYGRRGKIWADDEYDLFNGDYRENPRESYFLIPSFLAIQKPQATIRGK